MTPHRQSASLGLRSVALFVATVAILFLARDLLIPLASAITIAFLFSPVVAILERWRFPRVAAVLLVILTAGAAVGAIGWGITGQLVNVANDLPNYRENIHNKIDAMRGPSKSALGRATENVKQLSQEISKAQEPLPAQPLPPKGRFRQVTPSPAVTPSPVQIVDPQASGLQYLRDITMPVLAPLGYTTVIVVFTIFMLLHKEDLRNRLLRLAGVGRLNLMTQALDDAAQRISRYLFLQFLVNAAFGILFATGLYFIGLPYAALWGAVASLLRFVPYVGTLVAAALPFMLSLAVFDNWQPPLLVFLLFTGLEVVIANFVEPLLYGAHTGISPLALLVMTAFWTVLWGAAGLILSTPLTVCAVVLGQYVPQLSFLHILLGEEPVLEPDAHLYQRLLAMDQQEAHAITDAFLKEHSLLELYDSVIIPALALAEQDRHKGALDQVREEFMFLNVSEMIAEYAEAPEQERAVAPNGAGPMAIPRQANRFDGRVICIPARDEADGLTAAMLSQQLERAGFTVICLPIGVQLEDLKTLRPEADDIVCICALPPFAIAHSKALYRQVRERFAQVTMFVGVWGLGGDRERAKTHFEQGQKSTLVTTLADALQHVRELAGERRTHPSPLKT